MTGPVVDSFYRGAWCPICNTEPATLTEALPPFSPLGARLVAISPQPPDASQQLVQRLALGFDVLSDVNQSIIRADRLQFALDEDLHGVYRDIGMALDEHNADASWNLPVPATFVLDPDGIVRTRHLDPNYRERKPVTTSWPPSRRSKTADGGHAGGMRQLRVRLRTRRPRHGLR